MYSYWWLVYERELQKSIHFDNLVKNKLYDNHFSRQCSHRQTNHGQKQFKYKLVSIALRESTSMIRYETFVSILKIFIILLQKLTVSLFSYQILWTVFGIYEHKWSLVFTNSCILLLFTTINFFLFQEKWNFYSSPSVKLSVISKQNILKLEHITKSNVFLSYRIDHIKASIWGHS